MSAPKITPAHVERLIAVLGEEKEWATAEDLAKKLHGDASETKKRLVRAAAAAAGDGVVSYPGSPGYKLWRLCTVDELHACLASWQAQTEDMRRRRDLYRMRLFREHPATFREDPALRPSSEQLVML